MRPLDARATAEIEAASARVAMVTALVPIALADVAAALYSNLRMIRRIAEIYGGRSGSFGRLRLLRRVFTSLIATGAVALTDDLIGSVAGGGVLSKLSRRFGEGVVNARPDRPHRHRRDGTVPPLALRRASPSRRVGPDQPRPGRADPTPEQ